MKKIFLGLVIIFSCLFFINNVGVFSTVFAQEVSSDVLEDENITAVDLGVGEQTILPDSPFYFLKEWRRGLGAFFTLGEVNKLEVRFRHASEKLLEARKLAEKAGDKDVLTRAVEKYEKLMEDLSAKIEVVKEEVKNDPKFQEFMDKFTENGFKHQHVLSIIGELREDLPEEVKEKIADLKERVLDRTAKVLFNIDGEKLDERINKAIEKTEGSNFKNLKNLEVLKGLEGKLPEQAIPAIRRAQENALKRLKDDVENITDEERRERIENYLKNIRGDELLFLEIIEELKQGQTITGETLDAILAAENDLLNRIREKIVNMDNKEEWDKYLNKLQNGSVLRMIILERIKAGLSEEEAEKIEESIEKAHELFKNRIQNSSQWEKVLEEVKKLGTDGFEIIDKLETMLPEERKEFVNQMRLRLLNSVQQRVNETGDDEARGIVLRRITGDDANQLQVLERVQVKLQNLLPEPAEADDVLTKTIERQRINIQERYEWSLIEDKTKSYEGCKNLCGDGNCQEIVCLAVGCPCSENYLSCPADCQKTERKCANEGEYTSGAVAPEYYYGCCEGLKGYNTRTEDWVGGGLLCFDPRKSVPVCKNNGWYYANGVLLKGENCSSKENVPSVGAAGSAGSVAPLQPIILPSILKDAVDTINNSSGQ